MKGDPSVFHLTKESDSGFETLHNEEDPETSKLT
jgi:hypothetical protein